MIKSEKDSSIEDAVTRTIDKTFSVYTDVIIRETSLTREYITRWLKRNGFVKYAGPTSKRWTKKVNNG